MKRIIFSILLFSACAFAVQAQGSGCAKSCTAKSASAASCHAKVASASTNAVPAEHLAAAAKLASMDKSIEARKTEDGGVTYVRKETCGHSGSVSYMALSYDAAHNSFVNVSPSEVSTTTTKSAAGCGPAKATAGKACCAAGASTKACCASKAKTTTASSTNENEGKPVKTSGGTKN